MKNENKFLKYLEEKTPDEMNQTCTEWISYVDFISDENKFFEDLLKEYTLPVLEAHLFEKAKKLVVRLSLVEQQEKELRNQIMSHKKDLKYILDGVDQAGQQKDYIEDHKRLNLEISNFTEKYRVLKKEIFSMISMALKKQKQNRLLP